MTQSDPQKNSLVAATRCNIQMIAPKLWGYQKLFGGRNDPPAAILFFGAGTGQPAFLAAEAWPAAEIIVLSDNPSEAALMERHQQLAGYTNVRVVLGEASSWAQVFEKFDADKLRFDLIISEPVETCSLDFMAQTARQLLAENGLFVYSYFNGPSIHLMNHLKMDLLTFHDPNAPELEQIESIINHLLVIEESWTQKKPAHPYSHFLRDVKVAVQNEGANYVFSNFLSKGLRISRLADVAKTVAAEDLLFLCPLDLAATFAESHTQLGKNMLSQSPNFLTTCLIAEGLSADGLQGGFFCKMSPNYSLSINQNALDGIHVGLTPGVLPKISDTGTARSASMGNLTVNDPSLVSAIETLSETAALSLPAAEIAKSDESKQALLSLLSLGVLTPLISPLTATTSIANMPVASRQSRAEAVLYDTVTAPNGTTIALSAVDRILIQALNGENSKEMLIQQFEKWVEDGDVKVEEAEGDTSSGDNIIENIIVDALSRFKALGLLIA